MTEQERQDRLQLRLMRENPAVRKAMQREHAAARKLLATKKPLSKPKRGK